MSPVRIALLGAANSIHLQRWANALAARGHAICVLSQHPAQEGALDVAVQQVLMPHRGGLGYVLNGRRVRRALSAWQPDLLHVHYASGYGSLGAASGWHPMVLSVWGSDVYRFPQGSRLKRAWLQRNLRAADVVASTSLAMAKEVQRHTPERVSIPITPFGVDMELFVPRPVPDRPLTIGTVKTLAHDYGVDVLVRAFAQLLQDQQVLAAHPDLRLRLVGSGPERTRLGQLAESLNIASRTQFIDAVPHAQVPDQLNALDIYVAVSRSESFGVAVVEASACGVPVVVSDVGGLPEVVVHGRTGRVVPVENVSALAAELKALALDPAERIRLGQQGRQHVLDQFAWPRCVDRMEAVYRDLIDRTR